MLATTTPVDLVAPFAEALGFDDVVATRYEVRDGRYTGRLEGGFVWGIGKLPGGRAVGPQGHGVDLGACHAYSDSVFDVPLLSSGGPPPRRQPRPAPAPWWPPPGGGRVEHWDRPPGVPSLLGLEPYHLLRPFVRPEAFPYARFDIAGRGARAGHGPGAAGRQPPELLRRGRPRPWWPPASAGRCASWPSRRCSTPRWSAGWPGLSGASRWTGAAGRPSPLRQAASRPCGRARW